MTEEVKYIAAAEQQKKDCIRRMQEACGKEEPLPKQEIQDQDFESRKKELEYQKKELRRQEEKLKERLQGYEENLTALSAYSDFPLGERGVGAGDLRDGSSGAERFSGHPAPGLPPEYGFKTAGKEQAF